MEPLPPYCKKKYFRTILSIGKAVYRQQRFAKKNLNPILSKNSEKWGEDLPKAIHFRFFHYSGIIAGFFGETVCALHNEKPDRLIRQSLMLTGACSPLFDSFFDEYHHKESRLEHLLAAPATFSAKDIHEDLSQQLYVQLCSLQPFERMEDYLRRLFTAQLVDDNNLVTKPDFETAHNLCAEKGGLGALVFRSAIPFPFAEGEEEALYAFGVFVQYVDDLFDLQTDILQKHYSPLSFCNDWKEVEKIVEEQYNHAVKLVKEIKLPQKGLDGFLCRAQLYYKMSQQYLLHLKKVCPNGVKQVVDVKKEEVDFNPSWRLIYKLY